MAFSEAALQARRMYYRQRYQTHKEQERLRREAYWEKKGQEMLREIERQKAAEAGSGKGQSDAQ